jgi:mono/diheme cytochrome c family protein
MMPRDVLTICALTAAVALAACSAKTPGASESGPGGKTPGAAAPDAGVPAPTAAGERIYSGNCIPCHQQTGLGIPGAYPSLAGSPVVLGDPAELARWVLRGQRPASMPAGRYPTQMLQFGWMNPQDAAALFSYLRSNFGNSAPPVDAAAVAQALAQ